MRAVVDGTLAVQERRMYAPYGEPYDGVGTSQTVYGFTGEPTDANELVYLRARYLSPGLGVFASQDLLESFNRYHYASGNPTNRIDRNGLQDEVPWVEIEDIFGTSGSNTQFAQELCNVRPDLCVGLVVEPPVKEPPVRQPPEEWPGIGNPIPPGEFPLPPVGIPGEGTGQGGGQGTGQGGGGGTSGIDLKRLLLLLAAAAGTIALIELLRRLSCPGNPPQQPQPSPTPKSCDPQAFQTWWLNLPNHIGQIGNPNAAAWENSIARNTPDTFPGQYPKRIDLPGAVALGMRYNSVDADGATRNTCRLVDAKYNTSSFYNPNLSFLLDPGRPEIDLLKRYKYALSLSPAVGLEIRINRLDAESYWIAALQVAGFTYNSDGFVKVYYGANYAP